MEAKGQSFFIRAQRTNNTWRLTKPVPYPAQSASIESLLGALERLTPAAFIPPGVRRNWPHADEEEGLASPQATLLIQQGDAWMRQVVVGGLTVPGDQLYLQVVGVAGVYVVDAQLLREIPRTKDDWRDTALVNLKDVSFDRVILTNRAGGVSAAKVLELQQEPATRLWRIVNPIQARADTPRINELLQQLRSLNVRRFVSDDPKADLEALGLQPAQLELALARGTNTLAWLQFGRSLTNDSGVVTARCLGRNAVVTVATNTLDGWYGPVNAFRATNVIDLPDSVAAIEVYGQDHFGVQPQGTNGWRVLPQNLPADADLVKDLVSGVGHLPILEFFDAVTAPELARYGLTAPAARRYIFKSAPASPGATNPVIAEVDVGFTNTNRVFVNRSDEISVYAVKAGDIERLPTAGFQMRERRIWNYSDNDITRVVVRQAGKVRQLIHTDKGPVAWTLASDPGGTIDVLSVAETIRNLGQLAAATWVGHGAQSRARYGFAADGSARQITLEFKDGAKPAVVELGGPSPGRSLYGAVALDGEPWVFEFPSWLAEWIQTFLLPPP